MNMNINTILRPTNGHKMKNNDTPVGEIFSTYDYSKFKIISSNRSVDDNNVRRIVESFNDIYLMTIIIVNENFEIIDGQHRFNAAKQTGNPIYYTVVRGYGISEVQRYNLNSKNWNNKDFLHCYSDQGKNSYCELENFMKSFPDFGIQVSMRILSGKAIGKGTKILEGKKMNSKDFQNGKFSIANIAKAYIHARKVIDFKQFYSGYNRGTFVSAVIPLFENKAYDHKRMLEKAKIAPIHLMHCANIEQYRMLLQKIYNWKARPNDRSDFINI